MSSRYFHKHLKTVLFLTIAVIFWVSGCGNEGLRPSPAEPPLSQEEKKDKGPETTPVKEKIILFFVSEGANKLAGEEREITVFPGREIKGIILEELIKGPQKAGLSRTIPPDVRVLGIRGPEKGLVVVDFSRELLSSHWGGSTGEIMTVYSVVNTLALLPDIEKVKFLVEGDEIETLAGHLDISEPVEPDWGLIEK